MPNTPFICNNLPRKDLVLTYFLYTYALHCLTIGSAKVPDSVSLSPGVTGSAIISAVRENLSDRLLGLHHVAGLYRSR